MTPPAMTDEADPRHRAFPDKPPGETPGQPPSGTPLAATDVGSALGKIALGLFASLVLTGASFWAAGTTHVYAPAVPVLLATLAIGQMGVHLVFFLHVSSGPESTNNILALAFGVFVVSLVVFGSLIIMANLNAGMSAVPGSQGMPMAAPRQP
jgi:cytochrome o ubiquinol oxidase operon protein cyoD